MGLAFGLHPQSNQAERYGMLSFFCFLMRIAEFTNKLDPWKGIIGADSQIVLDTLARKADKDDEHKPCQELTRINGDTITLNPLSADWDVFIDIQYALTLLPGPQL